MAPMKVEDIRAMSDDQREDAVLNLKKERFNLRFQRATGQHGEHLAAARSPPRYHPASRPSPRKRARRSEEEALLFRNVPLRAWS